MPNNGSTRRALQFSIRDAMLAIVIVAVLLAWSRSHTQVTAELKTAREEARALRLQGALEPIRRAREKELADFRAFKARSRAPQPIMPTNVCNTPEEFIAALRDIRDWYEFADRTADPFAKTSVADEAVPALIELLSDPDVKVRTRAACTLGKIQRHSGLVVPALISLLEDQNTNVRWHAAFALGNFGPKAQAAVPALKEQMNDKDSAMAACAAETLRRIEPGADAQR